MPLRPDTPARLFHGSAAEGLTTLDPKPARVLGGDSAVFGTPDDVVAMSFARPWRDHDIRSGKVDGRYYLEEARPGAFDSVFNGPGYVYELDADGWKTDPRLTRFEKIKNTQVPVLASRRLDNVLEALRNAASENKLDLRRFVQKQAALRPDLTLQPHQARVADRVTGDNPRLLVYHGLGTGKSLASIAAGEKAKEETGDDYGVVVPASLRDNYEKEIAKFTKGSNPEIMSYSGLALGKQFQNQPGTLIVDEAARLRNADAKSTDAVAAAAANAKRLLLLTGTPIVNEPVDLASPLSMLTGKKISPDEFNERFVGHRNVSPGFINSLWGAKPGDEAFADNQDELKSLLRGHVDYQPGKSPEGVTVNQETINTPLTPEQNRIQEAIRRKIPLQFLWKLDSQFPLSQDELKRLNSFMTGLRQSSLSTQPFRADHDPAKAFEQSGKLQEAMTRLKANLAEDQRRKALIYSNFVGAGLEPYAAGLKREHIPYAMFHGGLPEKARQAALDDYNANKVRALLVGPAGAEGISTKGTSLIQLMDPYWNEARTSQAQGRGLRFDSHEGLPEELKNVAVQRYISSSQEPGWFGKLFGASRKRTGDEIIGDLSARKERLNEEFRQILREVGSEKQRMSAAILGAAVAQKQAAETKQATPYGMQQHAVHSFTPIGERRKFDDEEKEKIEKGKAQWIPELFPSLQTTPDQQMSSPTVTGVLGGLGGGALGALSGGALGHRAGRIFGGDTNSALLGAAIGGGLGGLGGLALGGWAGYRGRDAHNRDLEEQMARLPKGSNRRDMLADPAYQAELDRQNRLQMAMMVNRPSPYDW